MTTNPNSRVEELNEALLPMSAEGGDNDLTGSFMDNVMGGTRHTLPKEYAGVQKQI